MPKTYTYHDRGEIRGPVTLEVIRKEVAAGRLSDDMVLTSEHPASLLTFKEADLLDAFGYESGNGSLEKLSSANGGEAMFLLLGKFFLWGGIAGLVIMLWRYFFSFTDMAWFFFLLGFSLFSIFGGLMIQLLARIAFLLIETLPQSHDKRP